MTVIALYLGRRGTDRVVTQAIRFLLTVWLAYLVYGGWRWARWVAIVLDGGTSVFVVTSSNTALLPVVNRTGFFGGLILREDGAHGTTQQVRPGVA
jgi:hypothetical protein